LEKGLREARRRRENDRVRGELVRTVGNVSRDSLAVASKQRR
jgi:hypothetical protein